MVEDAVFCAHALQVGAPDGGLLHHGALLGRHLLHPRRVGDVAHARRVRRVARAELVCNARASVGADSKTASQVGKAGAVRTQQRAAVVLRGPRQRPVRRRLREDHATGRPRFPRERAAQTKQRGGGPDLHVALLRFHFGYVLWKPLARLEVGRSRKVRLPHRPGRSQLHRSASDSRKGSCVFFPSLKGSRCRRLQARARHGQGRAPDLVRAWNQAKPSVPRTFVRKHHLNDGQSREKVPRMKRVCRQKSGQRMAESQH